MPAVSAKQSMVPALPTDKPKTHLIMRNSLEEARAELQKWLGDTGMSVERVIKVAVAAVSRDPKLMDCTPRSLVQAVIKACEYGLEIGGALGHCYFVPFNKTIKERGKPDLKIKEATCIIGYKGEILMMARGCEEFADIYTEVVHKNDLIKVQRGTINELIHEPVLEGDPGHFIGAYAVVVFKNGVKKWHYMTFNQIERIRLMSPNGRKWDDSLGRYGDAPGGFWESHYEEMAKKTAIRQIFKTVPIDRPRTQEIIDKIVQSDLHSEQLALDRHSEQTALPEWDQNTGEVGEVGQSVETPPPPPKVEPPPMGAARKAKGDKPAETKTATVVATTPAPVEQSTAQTENLSAALESESEANVATAEPTQKPAPQPQRGQIDFDNQDPQEEERF